MVSSVWYGWYGLYGTEWKMLVNGKLPQVRSNYSKVVCRAKTDPRTLRNSKYSLIFSAKLTIHAMSVIGGALNGNAYTFNLWRVFPNVKARAGLSTPHTDIVGSSL
jgi:hypothetical protein